MGRLLAGMLPAMRRHPSGQARVRIGRRELWLGRYGSPEAQRRYDEVIAGIIAARNGWTAPAPQPLASSIALPPTDACNARPDNGTNAGDANSNGALPASIDADTAPTAATPDDITVAEVCCRFLQFADAEYRDSSGKPTSTIGNYRMAVRALRPYDDLSAKAFGPNALRDMMRRLVEEQLPPRRHGDPPRRWPRQTINRVTKSVRFIFTWAVGAELVSPDVPAKLNTVRLLVRNRTTAPEYRKVKEVPDDRIDQTLPHLPNMVADMVRIQRFVGCRPGDVCAMLCGDIDRSQTPWVWQPGKHKNSWREQELVYAIGPRAQRILAPYLERQPHEHCFVAGESEAVRNAARRQTRTSPLTPSQRRRRQQAAARKRPSRPYTEAAYRRAIARACDKHGITRWHPNQVRHTAGTEARQAAGLDAAQARLGHKSANVTETYAELTLKKKMEIAEMLG